MSLRPIVLAVIACFVAGCVLGGGSDDSPCDDYPESFTGTMTGTLDGQSFAGSALLFSSTGGDDDLYYSGTFQRTSGSGPAQGSFFLSVSCQVGVVMELKGWYEEPTEGDYPRGDLEGMLLPSGGTGSWDCTYGCTGGGTWTLQ